MTSWRGPQAFFHSPRISTGTCSGILPANTVQAVPCIPGRRSAALKISTLPMRGRSETRSAADRRKASAARDKTIAAVRCFMGLGSSVTAIVLWTEGRDPQAAGPQPARLPTSLRGLGQRGQDLADVGRLRLAKDLEQDRTDPVVAAALGATALGFAGGVLDEVIQLFTQDVAVVGCFRNS